MRNELKICLFGASGRMGQEIIKEGISNNTNTSERIRFIAGIVGAQEECIGQTISNVEQAISSNWEDVFNEANIIIDFSSPSGTMKAILAAKERKIPILIGTTGLSDDLEDEIRMLSQDVPVLRARNTSVGVNVMHKLVSVAAKSLGEDFDIEISEIHHKMKKDAPSGTALSLASDIVSVREVKNMDEITFGRAGPDVLRKPGELGIQSIRGGDIPGEHTVYFFGDGERIEITHIARDRKIFAIGVIKAACWLIDKNAGYYTMSDML
jgi:4-hydroxy-tetrahydrodipicolinate reductase